jgi:hypothetical protein
LGNLGIDLRNSPHARRFARTAPTASFYEGGATLGEIGPGRAGQRFASVLTRARLCGVVARELLRSFQRLDSRQRVTLPRE